MKERRAEAVAGAVAALKRGAVIVFPTETLYGLGADVSNSAAVDKVFQLKGRHPGNPIPVLVANRDMLLGLVSDVPPLAEKLIARFWPGPLTLVLPAHRDIPRPLVNATGSVGVRISSQPIANELVQALGHPITATSANPSGQPPARTIAQARTYFGGVIDRFIDRGELTAKVGSTVAAVIGDTIRIIRLGEITTDELQRAAGKGKLVA